MDQEKFLLVVKLGRMHFLVAGFLLYLLGVLLALVLYNQFSWERFLWGYAILLPAHLMVNYSNDYFDQGVDRYSQHTQFSGGSGILISHPELRLFAKNFSIVMMGISLLIGVIFTLTYDTPIILLLTITGNFLGWFYTAPPLRFSYHGLGEISTILSGFLIPGLGYAAMIGVLNIQFLLFSLPIMLFYLLFILSVEIPDREADRKGNKNTLVVRYGRTMALISMVITSAFATFIFLILPDNLFQPINLKLLAILSFIPTISSIFALLNRNKNIQLLNKNAKLNINALILFVALVNTYLLILIRI